VNSISAANGTELTLNGDPLEALDEFDHSDLNGALLIDTSNTVNTGNTPQTVVFSITAVPNTGPSSQAADWEVTVNPTDDIPIVTPVAQQVQENDSLALNASMFGYSDEENDELSHIVVDSFVNSLGVTLNVNGVPIVGNIIPAGLLNGNVVTVDASSANADLGDSINLEFHAVAINGTESEPSVLSIAVLPDNDEAVLTAQSTAVEIEEGDIVELSSSNFTLMDEENADVSQYVIQALPTEPGVTVERDGVALEVGEFFTEEELDAGSITINATGAPVLQNTIDAINVYADLDDNTRTNAIDLSLAFISIEDKPQLSTNTISSAPEDSTTIVPPRTLAFTDADGDTLIEYRLENSLSTPGFTLERDGVTLLPEDTFTQADLDQNLITIESDGTDISETIIDQFTVVAVSSNGIESDETNVNVLLQPNNDAPVLESGVAIVANENELTTLTPANFLVSDSENDAITQYTLITPIDENIGAITVNGQNLNTNGSFTQEELEANAVQIDLQALEISENTNTSLAFSVTTGNQTSVPHIIPVQINESNDAPEFALEAPLALTTSAEPGNSITIPEDAFTDSDDEVLTFSAAVQGEQAGTTVPLPAWLIFDSDSREFTLIDEPTQSELEIVLTATDPSNSQSQTALTLAFEEPPQLSAALPVIEVIAPPIPERIEVEAPPPPVEAEVVPEQIETPLEPDSEEPTDIVDQNAGELDGSQLITSGIESSRIDLASLLPSLNSATDSASDINGENDTTDRILSNLIGFTNNIDASNPFSLSSFESQSYQSSLDDLANRWDDDEELAEPVLLNINTTVGSSVGLSSGFTVGYMLWLLRGGTLMGSVLSSLPAWRMVDPLPVLAELDEDLDDDNESLESMVNQTNEQTEHSENQNAHP